jgi:hypothetical protein
MNETYLKNYKILFYLVILLTYQNHLKKNLQI